MVLTWRIFPIQKSTIYVGFSPYFVVFIISVEISRSCILQVQQESERSTRRAGGLKKPLGRKRKQLAFKTEIRSTKHETNSNDKNTNDKNPKPLLTSPYQALCFCFPRFKHLNIRISYLFRISIFVFRIFHGFAIFSPGR